VGLRDFGSRSSKKAENKDSTLGAAFPVLSLSKGSRDSNTFYRFYDFYDFYGFYDLSLTARSVLSLPVLSLSAKRPVS
jgi:hypothetical protein